MEGKIKHETRDRPSLQRAIFKTSRESEYFTEKELRAQIGHGQEHWPVAVLRELIDNSLDACEMAGVAPEVNISIQDDRLTVSDNGPGIPPEVIGKSLDYMVRVSDKAHYVSPTRGQMGNALKVTWATPYVATGKSQIAVTAKGEKHSIRVALDQIEGKPSIEHVREPFVRNGTLVSIEWKNSSALLLSPKSADSYKDQFDETDDDEGDSPPSAHELIESFAAFNPHAKFSLNGKTYPATEPTWKKWTPNMPTSAHWYNVETLRDLIAAYIANGRNGGRSKTVREFVSEFRGLSSTLKQKEVTAAWSGAHLDDFVTDGDVSKEFVADLLRKMQGACVAPKPVVLGMVGKDHLTAWMEAHGVTASSVKYACKKGEDEGMPYILETALGISKDDDTGRRLVTGLNWSPLLSGDPDPTIRQLIQEARIDPHDPVVLIVHIARPRFEFMDRGKTRIAL